MKSKRKFLIPALAVVLTAALAVGVFFFYKAFKKRIDPEDQMIHSTQERIEYAQSRYSEFSKTRTRPIPFLSRSTVLQRRSLRSSLPTAAASPRYTTV